MQSIVAWPQRLPAWLIAIARNAGLFALLASGASAAEPEFARAPAPDWVETVALPSGYKVPTQQISDGVYYLLADTQTRVEASRKVTFRRFATRTISAGGVQESANIEIPFDPSYQRLTLHAINVVRDGLTIEKLPGAAVRVLQREEELEQLIYDGSKTISVFLDDVRIGDVVDYSYSIAGVNPVFGNRHFGSFRLRWGAPLELLTARLLVPEGRAVTLHSRNGATVPRAIRRDGFEEYRMHLARLPALVVEKDAPSWFQPYPQLEWTEFADWNAVARWAAPLYRQQAPLSAALQRELARIRKAGLDDAGNMLAVLKLVQAEVRYLGVEIGAGSHAPTMPNQVFERRFGDCKDKTLLTIVLLEALGIQARPALVNTTDLRAVRESAPRPDAFDHVIVRAELAGKTYWLDPTRSVQSGSPATLFQPDFEVALIVDPASTGLVPMRVPASSGWAKRVHALVDASDGFDKPMRYTITTRGKGGSAESLRNTLATSNLQALQKDYLNFYASYYPKISVAAPMTASDDAEANQVTTVEHYLVKDFWVRSGSKPRREASVYAPEIEEMLKESPSLIRLSPLHQAFPLDLTLTTEVLLPEEWPVKAQTVRVDDPAFAFERVISAGPSRVLIVDRYRTLAGQVPAARAAAHADKLKLARDELGYTFSITDGAGGASAGNLLQRFNWPLAMLALVLLLGFSELARRLYRYDPPPATSPADPALEGFGGWLVLVIIGLVVLPVRVLGNVIEALPAFAADNWARLTVHGGADYHPLWAPALLFDLVLIIAQLVGAALVLVLFFHKRRSTPRVYIAFVLLSLAGATAGTLGLTVLPDSAPSSKDWIELARTAVAAAIWCPYWLLSKRVRATFTRAWRQPAAPRPAIIGRPASG